MDIISVNICILNVVWRRVDELSDAEEELLDLLRRVVNK